MIKKSKEYEHAIYEAGLSQVVMFKRVLNNVFNQVVKKRKDETNRYLNITKRLFDDNMTKHKLSVLNSYLHRSLLF